MSLAPLVPVEPQAPLAPMDPLGWLVPLTTNCWPEAPEGTIIISTATVLGCFGYVQCIDVGMYISLRVIDLETGDCCCPPRPLPPLSNEQFCPQKIRSEWECSLDMSFGARNNIVKRR